MALRRRQKRTERSKIDATPPWEVRHREDPDATGGPFDIRDLPEDEVTRIDLGALRVPVLPDVELRLDLNEAQQIVSVTLTNSNGQMQIGVFAAPRNEGIWNEVRAEIADSLVAQRGAGKDRDGGQFGTELVGRLPGEDGEVAVRFVGVDGPRWFVRAMLLGPIAIDDAAAAPFEAALRNVVVVRGGEPLPVREPVPLTMPAELQAAAGEDAEKATDA